MSVDWKLDPEYSRDCLIVDDDPAVVDTLQMYCENLAIFRNIIVAEDGQVATNKMNNQKFALMLVDINMPKKSGIELLKDFGSISNVNDTKHVVIISGELDAVKLKESMSSGVTNFIIKPFDEKTFREKIKPALNLLEN